MSGTLASEMVHLSLLKNMGKISNDLPCTSWLMRKRSILECREALDVQPNTHLRVRAGEEEVNKTQLNPTNH